MMILSSKCDLSRAFYLRALPYETIVQIVNVFDIAGIEAMKEKKARSIVIEIWQICEKVSSEDAILRS